MVDNRASVRFDSKDAERNVTSYAAKIGALSAKFKQAQADVRGMGSATRTAGSGMSDAARRAATLESNIRSLGNEARRAADKVRGFGSSFRSEELSKANGVIRSMAGSFDRTANSIKAIRGAAGAVSTQFRNLGRAAENASGGVERLSKKLAAALPNLGRAAVVLAALGSSILRTGASTTIIIRGLDGTAAAAGRASRAVDGTTGSVTGLGMAIARFRNVATFMAGAFGIVEIGQAADNYKLLRSRLDIVSDGTKELNANYKALLDSANKTRTGFKENANMFTRLMIAGEQYNMTAKDAIRLTENVNMALTISGATAGEAAAATQQLAQAFSSGRLQGDELRSVLENAPILARALTTNLAHLGVTMANLRDMAKEGKIGVKELMEAFASDKFTQELNEQFANIPVTLGQALTVAGNYLTDYIGRLDSASGATGFLSAAIVLLAKNLDVIVSALLAVAGVMVARYVAGLVAASAASGLFSAAVIGMRMMIAGTIPVMAGAAVAARTLGAALLAAFGGPVGAIITGVTLALGFFAATSAKASIATEGLYQEIEAQTVSLAMLDAQQVQASKGMSFLSGRQLEVAISTANLTGEVSLLANQWARVAVMAKAAAVEQAKASRNKSLTIWREAKVLNEDMKKRGVNPDKPSPLYDWAKPYSAQDVIKSGEMRKQAAVNFATTDAEYNRILNEPLAEFRMPDAVGGKEKPDKARRSRAAASPRAKKEEKDTLGDALKSLTGEIDEAEAKRRKFNEGVDTLTKSFDAGKLSLGDYRSNLAKLANKEFPGLTDAIKNLGAENDKLRWQNEGLSEATILFREQEKVVTEQVRQLDMMIAKDGDRTGVLSQQRKILVGQLGTYGEMVQENERLTKIADERKKKEEEITKIIDEASNKLYDSLTSRVREALDFDKNLFKNFFKSIIDMAKDMFASIIGAYIFGPIREGFRSTLESAFGMKKSGPVGSQAVDVVKSGLKDSEITSAVKNLTVNNFFNNDGAVRKSASSVASTASSFFGVTTGPELSVSSKRKTFIEELATGYKSTFSDLGGAFRTALKPLGDLLKPLLMKLNLNGEKLGKMVGGAQVGFGVSQLLGSAGVRSSGTGGAIGGALGETAFKAVFPKLFSKLGSFAGPLGTIAGSILGSVLGGMLGKRPRGAAEVSNTGTNAHTNDSQLTASMGGWGDDVRSSISQIADALGATVGSYSIGLGRYKDYYQVSTKAGDTALGNSYFDKKSANAVYDGTDSAAAMKAAISAAIRQGAIKGLSETSNKVLTTFKDTDRAIQLVKTLEDIKKSAAALRDPIKASYDAMKKNFENVIDMFKEMGASSADWTDLQEVMRAEFDNTIASFTDTLKEFREALTTGDRSFLSASDRLRAADLKFAEMEAKIASGQYIDQTAFTAAGATLQDLAREVFGSTPDFALYQQRLIAATDNLITNATAEADKYRPIVEALNANAAAAAAATNTTNDLLGQIAGALQGVSTGTGGRVSIFDMARY